MEIYPAQAGLCQSIFLLSGLCIPLPCQRIFSSLPGQLLRDYWEHSIVNLMGEVNRFLDGLAGGHHPHVYLPLSRSKTKVAEAIRLDHRYGLIVELRTPHLHECPVIFHLCFQAAITRWRYPLMGFLGDSVIAPFEELPRYTSGRWMHYNVKECGHVPANKSSPLGQP